jgi:outer membrane receptor for ferrienterochelin and colicins
MRRLHANCLILAVLPALLVCPAVSAIAQEAPATRPPAQESETSATATAGQTFLPDFFARFTPRSALDMVRQIPGFTIQQGGEERGLGQASANVLVNGQRLASKSDGIEGELTRITASNVVRIELVDASTLNVPGLTGQVANVIARTQGISGSFTWRGEARAHFADPLYTRFESSLSGRAGRIEYSLGLTNYSNRGAAGGIDVIRDSTGTVIETRDDVIKFTFDQPKLTAGIKYTGPGGEIGNLNLFYRILRLDGRVDETRVRPGRTNAMRAFSEREHSANYEISADFAFGFGPGRLKLIGLTRYNPDPYSQQSVLSFADGSPSVGDRYVQDAYLRETIGRAEYDWKMLGGDWQWSAETAFNTYISQARLFSLNLAGQFAEVPFPDGSGGVHEDRYESQLSFTRRLTPKLTLTASGGAEFSRLTQSGSRSAVRSFWRPKGAVSLAWVPQTGLDVTLEARRKVGQLDFNDFLARVFLEENSNNAGNNELVPPQSWEFKLDTKKSLGRWGSIKLSLFDFRIEDLVDTVPVGTGGESPGNLPSARRQGLDVTGTIEFAALGWHGAKLDLRGGLERSRVNDPLTGLPRPISETTDRYIGFDFRDDLPGTDWAWGFSFEAYHITDNYRLSEVGLNWEGPRWMGIFVENKDVAGLTLKASINNVLNARNRLDRTVWDGYRTQAPILFTEHRDRLIGPIFSFSVKGNF